MTVLDQIPCRVAGDGMGYVEIRWRMLATRLVVGMCELAGA